MTRFGILFTALVAGCTIQVTPPATSPPTSPKPSAASTGKPTAADAVVLRFESKGGFCAPPGCDRKLVFRADGTFDAESAAGGKQAGAIDVALVERLRAAIARQDFDPGRLNQNCGLVADAPEQTWAFATDAGEKVFTDCSAAFAGAGPAYQAGAEMIAAASQALAVKGTPTPAPTALPTALPTLAPTAPEDAIVTVRYHGGLCTATGRECYSRTDYRRDGRYKHDDNGTVTEGQVDAALVAAVAAEIARADFAAIEAKPFTGLCATAVDGQEAVYAFETAGGTEEIASCRVAIPEGHPLFEATDALEEARR